MSNYSTMQKLEQNVSKPIASGLIAAGISLAMGDGQYQMNLGPIGEQSLPVANGIITGITSLATETISLWIMPYITPHYQITTGVLNPLVAGATCAATHHFLLGDDAYNSMQKSFAIGALGDIGGQYVETNILLKC
jgi:hypothetical protein